MDSTLSPLLTRRIQIGFHLIAIAVFAFALRHYGWQWDRGAPWSLHPDERHMVTVTQALESTDDWFNTSASTMNPYHQGIDSYVYGTLPLTLTHFLTVNRGLTERADIIRIGRLLSALWSTGTVMVLYVLMLRLVNARWASLAAFLMSITVLAIQQAHFYTVDSAGVFFATLTVALGLIACKENRNGALVLSGATVGLAMACRLNLGLLAFWVILVSVAMAWNQRRKFPLLALGAGGTLALFLFRVLQPYAFKAVGFIPTGLNPEWLKDIEQVRSISHGTLEVPFTLQWVDRIPWLYALEQLTVWGLGLSLGLLCLGGAGFLLFRHRKQPEHWHFLLVLWPLILIGYHGGIFLHTLRYFLPAYPALILAGVLAIRYLDPAELRRIILSVVATCSVIYCVAFLNLYREEHPQVAASKWLFEQLPYGGTVVSEHWDMGLPLHLKGSGELGQKFTYLEIPVYDPESESKLDEILSKIDQADYLILSTTRASYTIPRVPVRYPVMANFYTRLREGSDRSGLKEVARFHRIPQINEWGINTLKAEEAFRVYDHPLVRIYEKTPVFSVEALRTVLTEGVDFDHIPRVSYSHAGKWNNGWLSREEWSQRSRDTAIGERFPEEGFGNQTPIGVWWMALLLLGTGSYPIAFFCFPSLRDRGAGVARLLGLVLISYLAWLPASIGLLPFESSLPLAVILVFGASACLIGLHHETLLMGLKRCWKRVLITEAVFWFVFALFLGMRIMQPDLWHPWAGGEKPMDVAFLSATANTSWFPPLQPWLSGAFINYYYYGFVLIAGLIQVTGIAPEIAYNLALPTLAAFTAAGVFTLASSWLPFFQTRRGWKGSTATGLVAAALTLLAGNLGQLRWLLGSKEGHFSNEGYWDASRVIQVPTGDVQPITEFPFFTFLYGDLHAHMMALPVAVFALICSWQLFRRFHPLRVALCALALGSVWMINAWDFPVQAAIFIGLCVLGVLHQPKSKWVSFLGLRLGWVVIGLIAARLLFLPYHNQNLPHPVEFGLWTGPRTHPMDLLLAHGLFLIPLLACGVLWRWQKPETFRRGPLSARLFWGLILAGCVLLILLVEVVHLKSDIGRMNTVFKFYYQAWWLLAILTAVMTVPMISFNPRNRPRFLISLAVSGCLTLGLIYPVTAVQVKWNERIWSTDYRGLDGWGYMKTATLHVDGTAIALNDDLQAIRWLRKNAGPTDILIEAHRPEYQWGARMSWHTGLPTVLGWNWHMRQQRPLLGSEGIIWQRAKDIEQFYTTTDPAVAKEILKTYNVAYVVVGELERITYGLAVEGSLTQYPFLSKIFHVGNTAIYQVEN